MDDVASKTYFLRQALEQDAVASWTFLTNHGQVLLAIARNPQSTEREIAATVGITERAVQRIIADLEEAGYMTRVREGRRNHYHLHPHLPLRHGQSHGVPVGDLLHVLSEPRQAEAPPMPAAALRGAAADGS